MAATRTDPRQVEQKREQIGRLKEYIARMNALNSMRLSEQWPAYKQHLQTVSDMAVVSIKNILSKEKDADMASDWGTMKKLLGQIQVAEAMILEVEQAGSKIDVARENIAMIESEIKLAEDGIRHAQEA